jgi:hypothetical protein
MTKKKNKAVDAEAPIFGQALRDRGLLFGDEFGDLNGGQLEDLLRVSDTTHDEVAYIGGKLVINPSRVGGVLYVDEDAAAKDNPVVVDPVVEKDNPDFATQSDGTPAEGHAGFVEDRPEVLGMGGNPEPSADPVDK